ncbi:MAG TPA: Holliday junction resolvase RuvX [Planctomycetota bacterium]|nr:Holliday junction resolvase RuvX [Planctomycetota bacterium]HRR78776.1 Holliday junction resolvase RuvX [Planctomycetota bacterium]HRT96383.1 Holliday junction resolvase RuvX [Planctomycetota bacterium]
MRLLGIDYGDRRIGLAIGDTDVGIAMGLPTLERPSPATDVTEPLRRICREQGIQRIIVGLPVNMDSTHGERARLSLAFVQSLRNALGIEVEAYDERLTTQQADRAMLEGNLSRKKRQARVDRLAAQLLLQSYLDAMRGPK